MKISRKHSNRKLHNWLIYDINDKFLEKYAHLYKGALYDLGSGESPYRDYFLAHAVSYFAVDWSGSLHKTRLDLVADLNKPLSIEAGVADTIVSLSVLEHLSDPQVMVNETFRILKPGGHLVLQVPWQWWLHEIPHDYFRYTPYGLRHALGKAGYMDVKVEAQAGFFSMIVLKINYFSRRLVRGPAVLRKIMTTLLLPFWTIGQVIAPRLDWLDRNWELEATGYFVTARKPDTA